MVEKVLAKYERTSTLWKNANAFYVAQDWTKMDCVVYDYSEDIETACELGVRYFRGGVDVTEEEFNRIYGRPYAVRLTNKRGTNIKEWRFATKDEANEFWKSVMNHRIMSGWHKA